MVLAGDLLGGQLLSIETVDGFPQVKPAVRFSRTAAKPPPVQTDDNAAVLLAAGLTEAEIAKLKAEGVLA